MPVWHDDGPKEGVSSLDVLLDWMTTGNNYATWKGGNKNSGKTKKTIASTISEKISRAGIKTERKPKDIMMKIASIEAKFKQAYDWLHNTGSGVEDKESLKEIVLGKCQHFYTLEPIMGDRASTQPLATEENLEYHASSCDDSSKTSDSNENTEHNVLEDNDSEKNDEEFGHIVVGQQKQQSKQDNNGNQSAPSTSKKRKKHISVGNESRKKRLPMEIAITESINKMKMEMNQEQGNYKEREVSAREKEVDLKKWKLRQTPREWKQRLG